MNRFLHIAAILLAFIPAAAQNKATFKYDVNFGYEFNNREYDAGGRLYSNSYTTNAARLTPSVGLDFKQSNRLSHNVMLGIDLFKNMGDASGAAYDKSVENWDMFKEITLWYNIEARLDEATIRGWAGIFPRRFSVFGCGDTPRDDIPGRNIPTVFLSDYFRFYDNNVEGILISAARRNAYYELGLDWLGMYGNYRREQFKVYTYGKGRVLDWMNMGWSGEIHHYANAVQYGHVMDNVLLSPFIEFDMNEIIGSRLQDLKISLNAMTLVHRDRKEESSMNFSGGGQLTFAVRNWNVGLFNETYFGNDLMPYFSSTAPEGSIYGTDLYHGNPYYRVGGMKEDGATTGLYNKLEAYYQPGIADFLDLRISAVMHFTDAGFQGWQQKIGLVFNLEKALTSERRRAARERQEWIIGPRIFEKYL